LEIDGKTLGKLHHHEIMNLIDMVDLERGTKVAGHRGFFLKGVGVLLNQALINFGIETLYKAKYTPLQPPYFMKANIMHETCQLSDFEENLYKVEGAGAEDVKDADSKGYYLIATSEQPISAMHRGEWLEP
jgi:seryl-tRNA synthetase